MPRWAGIPQRMMMLAMMRLIAWIHAHSTDGIVYGGDKAARDQGFMAWADASFADGFKALRTQESIIKFDGSAWLGLPSSKPVLHWTPWSLSTSLLPHLVDLY